MVIRPKSIATVVVVFVSTPDRSSMPVPASVRISSVRIGPISLTEPTIVVLPAPKWPAMRILTAVGRKVPPASEGVETMHDRLEDEVGRRRGAGRGGPGDDE